MALRVDAVSFMTLGIQIVIGNYFLATDVCAALVTLGMGKRLLFE